MPPKRKPQGPTRTTSASQQGRLSFHGQSGKITKRVSSRDGNSAKKDLEWTDVVHVTPAEADKPFSSAKTTDLGTKGQVAAPDSPKTAAAESEDPLRRTVVGPNFTTAVGTDEQNARARDISDARIKGYWRDKEQERLGPRVHQGDLTIYEKVLREWDMSGQYGPSIGIARVKRWKRAHSFGLNPPIEVLAVLLKEMEEGHTGIQRAYTDELLSTRFAVET